jgi:hypothetical protein
LSNCRFCTLQLTNQQTIELYLTYPIDFVKKPARTSATNSRRTVWSNLSF